jgi:hypothetical protein
MRRKRKFSSTRFPSSVNNKQNGGNSARQLSIARLWHDQDKRDHARELLGLIYGRFNAGFDMLGMKEHNETGFCFPWARQRASALI